MDESIDYRINQKLINKIPAHLYPHFYQAITFIKERMNKYGSLNIKKLILEQFLHLNHKPNTSSQIQYYGIQSFKLPSLPLLQRNGILYHIPLKSQCTGQFVGAFDGIGRIIEIYFCKLETNY